MMSDQERIELNKTLPRRMLVRDGGSRSWEEGIVLHILPGKIGYPVIIVVQCDESEFEHGTEYNTTYYKHCKELPIPKVQEMTLEQVCKELGREIKIIK